MGIQINGQTDTISAFDNNFSLAGNVSIGGTLTYEDVTSVDAVGLSTFKAGIQLDDSITHLGDENTKIRFPAADTFTVETGGNERFRIVSDGGTTDSNNIILDADGRLGIGTNNPVGNLEVRDSKANLIVAKDGLTVKSNSNLHTSYDMLQIGAGGALASYSTATATADTQLVHNAYRHSGGTFKYRYADTAMRIMMNSPGGSFRFQNAASGSADADITFTERLRITSGGEVGINNTSPQSYASDGRNLVIGNSSSNAASGITLVSGTGGYSTLYFADGTSGTALYSGTIVYDHSDNRMDFWTNSVRRLRIDSNGRILVGPGAIATPKCGYAGIDIPNNDWAIIMGGSDGNGNRANNANKDGRFAGAHYVNAEEPIGIIRCSSGATASELHIGGGTSLVNAATQLSFYTAANTTTTGGTERLRIASDGQIGMGKAGTVTPNGNSPLTIQESDSNSETICLRATNSGGNGSQPGIVMKTAAGGHIGGIYCDVNSDYMRLSTSGTDRVIITNGGGVTIGSGNNDATWSEFGSNTGGLKIDDVGVSNTGLRLSHGNDDTYLVQASNSNFYISQYGTGSMVFGVGSSGNEKFRIDSSGLVRVGHPTANHSSNVTQDLEIKGRYVNAAGDFSRLIFGNSDDSGGSTASIRAERNGNNFGTELKFFTNPQSSSGDGLERLRINRDGIVTKPYNPSFSCYKNGHFNFTSNTNTTIKPWTEHHDTHNDFNATTGVFTAPVAGKYFFYITVMQQRQGNGDFQLKIYKNGALYVHSNDMNDAATTTFQQTTINAVMSLAANDTASFVTRNSTDTTSFLYQGQYTHCGGYLIG